ncbi:hypothetical protein J6590_094509, partial [Homalodisca vitripennis]
PETNREDVYWIVSMDTKKYSLFRNQDLLPASRNVILLRECVDCWRRTVSGDMCRYSSNFSSH